MPSAFHLFGGTSRAKIPPELSSKSELLKHIGVSPAELKKIWWFRHRMYSHFNISKRSGKFRLISAPDYRLKMLQQKIARSLSDLYNPRKPVHGFVPDRSVRSNAESHLRRNFILNVDIKDFFPTITEARVQGLLQSIGMDSDVSGTIARLCTNNGCLPQGAPSSPVISNMICFRLDKSLMGFSKEHRLLYTRYADDITLSSFQPLTALFEGERPDSGRLPLEKLSGEFLSILGSNGFELNSQKIHYADKNSRRMATGIKINEGLNVDRRYVRNIRSALFKVEKSGPVAAQAELGKRLGKPCSIQAHLQGKISWVGFVKGQSDPVFRGLAKRYNQCFSKNPIKINPTETERADRAIWVVETNDDTGTAFFLEGVGLVTAAHCVCGASEIEVFHPLRTSNRFKVEVKHLCSHRDLAILEHTIGSTEYFELVAYAGSPTIGADTLAAGFPTYGFGDRLNVRKGSISSLMTRSAVPLIEVSQMLGQGMSGGPLMNEDHEVLGIIHKGGPVAYVTKDGSVSPQRQLIVAISELKAWASTLL
ncbi:MAG: reverse transcriptase domain-containing protein [Planktotalea arctica]|uniref:reverse transcriptase domain-containing protein n=1 Tax=Planktotalea arctica TaxID=1481893 RepID=UPI003219B724